MPQTHIVNIVNKGSPTIGSLHKLTSNLRSVGHHRQTLFPLIEKGSVPGKSTCTHTK